MTPTQKAAWPAILSLSAGVFGLVAAEFFPASLLTPMAADLAVSESIAGQAVTATAIIGLLAALFTAIITRRIDRRRVVLGLTILLILSNLAVAFAQDMVLLLAGRVVLGAALGGFWALAPALAIRLVPEQDVPRAMSTIAMGVSAATILAAPVGAWLGDIAGWRMVYLTGAGLGFIVLVFQALTLPSLPPTGSASLQAMAALFSRRGVITGLASIILIVVGHFALFTYVRPFLETVSGAGAQAVTLVLLGYGIGNVLGNFAAGPMAERSLTTTLALAPLGIATIGAGLGLFGGELFLDGLAIAAWGIVFGLVPVGWTVWINRMTPDAAEAGGALVVASFQAAITLGALGGGAVLAAMGPTGLFSLAAITPAIAVALIVLKVRLPRPATA